MPIGICPLVDFAFKMIFGRPENVQALIGLLNAILNLKSPIMTVQIRNPFNYKEFQQDKFIMLDIRATDSSGRSFNIEMQIQPHDGMLKRLTYYACQMYVDQLQEGDSYHTLKLSLSICLMKKSVFSGTERAHHRFRLLDSESGLEVSNGIEVHTVELEKYNLSEATISTASPVEQWAFFLLYAQDYEVDRLRELLPAVEFQQAITVIQQIAEKTEDKIMYDQRVKAQLDYQWRITTAHREGVEKGMKKGMKKGMEKGQLLGRVQVLSGLLNEPESDFASLSLEELAKLEADLQARLRNRGQES